jgi:hypothetical protein
MDSALLEDMTVVGRFPRVLSVASTDHRQAAANHAFFASA